jgi:hypothetical protein
MGLIEVKTYTSAAEIYADANARRARLWGKPVVRNIIVNPPKEEEQKDASPRGDPWLIKTPEQRCSLIRELWTPGCTMKEVADRIEQRLGRKMSKSIIQSHVYNYGGKYLDGIIFNADSGYRGTFNTMRQVNHEGLTSGEYFKALCASVHMSTDRVVQERRDRELSRIRQVAAYLIKKHYPKITLYGVGRIIARDPTTAKACISRVEKQVEQWVGGANK